jgi:hypothetical protein
MTTVKIFPVYPGWVVINHRSNTDISFLKEKNVIGIIFAEILVIYLAKMQVFSIKQFSNLVPRRH